MSEEPKPKVAVAAQMPPNEPPGSREDLTIYPHEQIVVNFLKKATSGQMVHAIGHLDKGEEPNSGKWKILVGLIDKDGETVLDMGVIDEVFGRDYISVRTALEESKSIVDRVKDKLMKRGEL